MNKVLLYLILGAFSISVLLLLPPSSQNDKVAYSVSITSKYRTPKAIYIPNSKVLKVFVNVVCCSDGIEVRKNEKEILVKVIDKDGVVCKCFETKEIVIPGLSRPDSVIFVDYNGEIKKLPLEVSKFCGVSTFGECNSDKDCVVTGCSNEVCASKHEKPIYSACVYKTCYDYRKYGVGCRCVLGRCMWV